MLCFRCGSQVTAGATACTNCGQTFTTPQPSGAPRSTMATPTLPRLHHARTTQSALPFKLNELACERYEIRRLIGEGPLGVVYVAHDRATQVDLALKVIRPAMLPTESHRETFLEAMQRVRGVGHIHLNHVIDAAQDGERCFFTAPLLEGLSLRKLMALRRGRSERFGLAEVVPIAAQVADALDAGARVGPHGNLKPDNLIILPDMLKLTDFGLAMALPPSAFVPAQRSAVESSQYLSPEVREHARPGRRSDLYSFGILLLELLTGTAATAPPVRLRDVQVATPEALESLLDRLLSENPTDRPSAIDEVLQELAAAESGITRGAATGPVRRTFAPEQTQRISLDMLEEVIEVPEGVDEDAFAASIEAHAASIDQQAAAALATDGQTDPNVPARDSRRARPAAADVTQKLTADMVELVLEEERTTRPHLRPATEESPLGDGLDPRLVRAALGVELDETEADRTEPSPVLDEISDPTVRGLPPFPDDVLATAEKTEQMVPIFQESTEPTIELRPPQPRGVAARADRADSKKTIPDRPPVRAAGVGAAGASASSADKTVRSPPPAAAIARSATPRSAPPPPAVSAGRSPTPPPPGRPSPAAVAGRSGPATTLPGHVAPPPPPATPLVISPVAAEPRAAATPTPKQAPVSDARPLPLAAPRRDPPPRAVAVDAEPVEDQHRRAEPTRIVPRFEERRTSSSIWVWIALAIGASAFMVGAGFYWRRLRADEQHRVLQQIILEHQQQQQQQNPTAPPSSPSNGAAPSPPAQAPPSPVAPPAPP